MKPEELTHHLSELLRAHGLSTEIDDGWVLVDGKEPALRGLWHPNHKTGSSGQLDIQVVLANGRIVEE